MKLKNPELWAECVKNNGSDPYSGAGVRFAERWANLMEEHMEYPPACKEWTKA